VRDLSRATRVPHPDYQRIGVHVDGEYRQLNANLLQIENEYYSTVRPKQLLEGLEKPTHALTQRGIRYVELRSMDINPYQPAGLCKTEVRFLEAFMLACLLADSPTINRAEQHEIDNNMELVAHRGREPGLALIRDGRAVPLKGWAWELLDAVQAVAELLDAGCGGNVYRRAVREQGDKVCDAEETPSARLLAEMRANGEGFYAFAQRLSQQHQRSFMERGLSPQREAELDAEANASLARQTAIEAADALDLDTFLARYFAGL
jgi:glutamate--cysteine ligase